MDIFVRPARKADGAAILTVHRRAIHEIACADYPQEILDAWGPPILAADLPREGADFDRKMERREIVLVAEINDVIAGFGQVVPSNCELRAVFVSPDFQRRGVGTSILRALERIATDNSVPYLQLDSSLTAAPFYSANGYAIVEKGTHTLRNGATMSCVKMRKDLP